MTSTHSATVLAAVRALCPEITARAAETEARGSIAPDLYDKLVATGYFRSLWPEAYGGYEFTLPELDEMITEGARADGSVGWLMMIGAQSAIIRGFLPKETLDELVSEGADLRMRGAVAPKGRALPTDGGYVVSGQWPFASGGPEPQ